MRKLLSILLVILMLVSFCGCNKKDKKDEQQLSKTITASNDDEIEITLKKGDKPTVTVCVNDKEIYSFDKFKNYKDEYDFGKDFTDKIIDEYSDDKILWAYRFDWGIIYSTKSNYLHTEDTNDDATLFYVCPKHEYEKCYFKNVWYNILAEEWNLIDFETIPETGEKIFWDSYTAAQVVFEELYKTDNYKLTEIKDLAKAGYSIDEYYEMHNREFGSGAGLNKWEKIYEVSVDDKPFALIFSDAATSCYLLQELDWENPYIVICSATENGAEYSVSLPSNGDKLTTIS